MRCFAHSCWLQVRWDVERLFGRGRCHCFVRVSLDVSFLKKTIWRSEFSDKIHFETISQCGQAGCLSCAMFTVKMCRFFFISAKHASLGFYEPSNLFAGKIEQGTFDESKGAYNTWICLVRSHHVLLSSVCIDSSLLCQYFCAEIQTVWVLLRNLLYLRRFVHLYLLRLLNNRSEVVLLETFCFTTVSYQGVRPDRWVEVQWYFTLVSLVFSKPEKL